jgi:hypothetical protein
MWMEVKEMKLIKLKMKLTVSFKKCLMSNQGVLQACTWTVFILVSWNTYLEKTDIGIVSSLDVW